MNVRFLAAIEADDVRARYGTALSDAAAHALSRAADAHILAIDDALPEAASAALIRIGAVVVPAGASTLIAVSRAALELGIERASGDARDFLEGLGRAFDRAAAPAAALRARDRALALDAEARVMGIVNVTPDSFYERVAGIAAAVAKTREMVAAGAAIVDVGGQSYAHWNPRIAPDEEAARVVPVVEAIVAANLDVTISIDTFKAAVADAALGAGAHLINDCSGLSDPALPETVARHDAGLVVMHLKGTLMVREPEAYVYRDALAEIVDFLYERTERAVAEGVAREAIAVDPGLEFGKEPETDLEILDRFAELRALGYPILFASSRKSFIGRIFNRPAKELLVPSLATAAIGIAAGARILRVHDVAETVQLARMMAAIAPGRRAGLAFAERMPGTPQAGNPTPPREV
ncbi:MAG: dihydropteroate synthase [Candidatus Eremiobacteraeota bacterium]|nr:dihydropteroate synthase [Candidatus Eremiobacteraeota bacterium]